MYPIKQARASEAWSCDQYALTNVKCLSRRFIDDYQLYSRSEICCSAARALARRLANEQAMAIASAKSAAGDSLDEEELEL